MKDYWEIVKNKIMLGDETEGTSTVGSKTHQSFCPNILTTKT